MGTVSAGLEAGASTEFSRLPPLRVVNTNTRGELSIRLYDASGRIDADAAAQLDGLLCDGRDPEHVESTVVNRRTLQLLYKAAYHFRASRVDVVSAYRKPGKRREGPHGSGRAIDFKLPGVSAAKLAAYLRTLARVGVGVYTHPRTQFVHLDVREQSFHWLDASPPGRTWRERSLGNRTLAARDSAYRRENDWPEGTHPTADVL